MLSSENGPPHRIIQHPDPERVACAWFIYKRGRSVVECNLGIICWAFVKQERSAAEQQIYECIRRGSSPLLQASLPPWPRVADTPECRVEELNWVMTSVGVVCLMLLFVGPPEEILNSWSSYTTFSDAATDDEDDDGWTGDSLMKLMAARKICHLLVFTEKPRVRVGVNAPDIFIFGMWHEKRATKIVLAN